MLLSFMFLEFEKDHGYVLPGHQYNISLQNMDPVYFTHKYRIPVN